MQKKITYRATGRQNSVPCIITPPIIYKTTGIVPAGRLEIHRFPTVRTQVSLILSVLYYQLSVKENFLDYVFLNVLEKIVEKRGKTRENRTFGAASSSFGRCVAENSVKYNPPQFGQTTITYPENLQSLASCYCENSPRLLGFVPPAYKPRCTHKKVTPPTSCKMSR